MSKTKQDAEEEGPVYHIMVLVHRLDTCEKQTTQWGRILGSLL